MRKRRIGPLLLLAIMAGAATYSYLQQSRADRFDREFALLLETTQAKAIEVASGRDTAEEFFGWLGGQGLEKLNALPPATADFQKALLAKTKAMFQAMADKYKTEPLVAVATENYQGFYLEIQNTATALAQARVEPAQF